MAALGRPHVVNPKEEDTAMRMPNQSAGTTRTNSRMFVRNGIAPALDNSIISTHYDCIAKGKNDADECACSCCLDSGGSPWYEDSPFGSGSTMECATNSSAAYKKCLSDNGCSALTGLGPVPPGDLVLTTPPDTVLDVPNPRFSNLGRFRVGRTQRMVS